ncbi:MAG: beta-lactamase family protein [Deltaproteobacteria bacterium]|nr:beta-lactamase family protein [Deltaproteobacteria bacterium]
MTKFGPAGPPASWGRVEAGLSQGLADRVCTAACLVVGLEGRVIFEKTVGRISDEPGAGPAGPESVFDLASLTKPLAAGLACLGLVESGKLDLSRPLGQMLSLPPALAALTPAHLLSHASGLPAWRPFYKDLAGLPWPRRPGRLADLLAQTGLEHRPGSLTLYSDLNFMLLQLLIEEITDLSLAEVLAWSFYEPLGLRLGFFVLPDGPGPIQDQVVASERCPWRKRLLQGEVNDENAWALGGIAGQAGLFGPALDVFKLMSWLAASVKGRASPSLLSPKTAGLILTRPFAGRSKNKARTIGFDVPEAEGSVAGRLFGPGAIGHLGFVGASLWHQPQTGLIVVLLTNRTIFGRENQKIQAFRIKIHNLVADALDRAGLQAPRQ